MCRCKTASSVLSLADAEGTRRMDFLRDMAGDPIFSLVLAAGLGLYFLCFRYLYVPLKIRNSNPIAIRRQMVELSLADVQLSVEVLEHYRNATYAFQEAGFKFITFLKYDHKYFHKTIY